MPIQNVKLWEDVKLYWAWRGAKPSKENPIPPAPTTKRLDYVTVDKGTKCEHQLCIGVWDDDIKYTPLNRNELEFHLKQYHWIDETPFPLNGTPVNRPK